MTWGGFGGSKPAKATPATTEKHSLLGALGHSIQHALHMDERQQQQQPPAANKPVDKPAPVIVATTQPDASQAPPPATVTASTVPASTESATPSRPATAWSGFGSSSGRPAGVQNPALPTASSEVDMDRLAAKLDRLVSFPSEPPVAAADPHSEQPNAQPAGKVFVLDESDEDMDELLAAVQPKVVVEAAAKLSAAASTAPLTQAVPNAVSPTHAASPHRAATPVRRVSVANDLPVTAASRVASSNRNAAAVTPMPDATAQPTSSGTARSPPSASLRPATPVRRVSVAESTMAALPVAVPPVATLPPPPTNAASSSNVDSEVYSQLQQQYQDLQHAYTALNDRDTLRSTLIQGLNTQVQQLQAKVSDREQQLKTQQSSAAQQLAVLQTKYNSLKDKLSEQLEGSSQLVTKLGERDAKVARYQTMLFELQSLHQNTIPVVEVQTVLQQKEHSITELRRQISTMQQQHELLQQQHATSEKQLQLLRVQSDVTSSDLQGRYDQLTQQFESEKAALLQAAQKSRAESSQHQQRAEHLADTVAELQADNIRKQSDVTAREQTLIINNTKLTKQLQRSQAEAEQLQQQVEAYGAQHKRMEQQLYERKVQVDTLSNLLQPARAIVARHDAEPDEMLSATIKLPFTNKQSNLDLQTRIDQLASEFASLQATG